MRYSLPRRQPRCSQSRLREALAAVWSGTAWVGAKTGLSWRRYKGVINTIAKVSRTEGFWSLYNGFAPYAPKRSQARSRHKRTPHASYVDASGTASTVGCGSAVRCAHG